MTVRSAGPRHHVTSLYQPEGGSAGSGWSLGDAAQQVRQGAAGGAGGCWSAALSVRVAEGEQEMGVGYRLPAPSPPGRLHLLERHNRHSSAVCWTPRAQAADRRRHRRSKPLHRGLLPCSTRNRRPCTTAPPAARRSPKALFDASLRVFPLARGGVGLGELPRVVNPEGRGIS